jgi:hypothetical protein
MESPPASLSASPARTEGRFLNRIVFEPPRALWPPANMVGLTEIFRLP